MKPAAQWILVVGVLVVLGLTGAAVVGAVRTATSPVENLSSGVATQVARILNPTPTIRPDPVVIIREVRALARLETIQYSVERVITAETGQGPLGFLFGDRLLLIAHGVVIAGVDLGRLKSSDIAIDDLGRVTIQLPAAEVFVATLDNDKSYVYDRDTGLLTRGDIQLEAEARRVAEAAIRQAAIDDGILEQAQVNAEAYLARLLLGLGHPEVEFRVAAATPEPTLTLTPKPLPSATP